MSQFASTLYPQTNPTNPLLLRYRDITSNTDDQLRDLTFLGTVTDAQVSHAQRVFARLSSLSG
jgi:hypothetical protein